MGGVLCRRDTGPVSYTHLADAVKMMTLTPARIMKVDDCKGSLAVGKDADIVIFDEEINVKTTIIGGKCLTIH